MSKEHTSDCKACNGLKLSVKKNSSSLVNVEIFVPQRIVQRLEKYAVLLYKNHSSSKGFDLGSIPQEYIKDCFKQQISDDLKKFILKFVVLDFLQNPKNLQENWNILCPRLKEIRDEPNGSGITYIFNASIINHIDLADWRKLSFIPPRRKLYKDLDRQAKMFLEKEVENKPAESKDWGVQNGDWVKFTVQALCDDTTNPLKGHSNSFWMKIATTYLVDPFQQMFFGKKKGEHLYINKLDIQGLPQDTLSRKGKFDIAINSIWRTQYFCVDFFKQFFCLQSTKDIHDKLIEVFSFRNDISQRRSIIEEVFRTLFARFRLEVPRHLILRRQELILRNIKNLPDYHVYKANNNFVQQVEELSERQLCEENIIDCVTHKENILLDDSDIEKYLNLLSNSRLTEFIYFKPLLEEFGRTVLPIREQAFTSEVLREKTLNFIINTISRKDPRYGL